MKSLSVLSIKKIGKQKSYDITVDNKYHNFLLGDGVVSGNCHSMAYSAIAYRTAYLKANYPREFMTCLLTVDSGDSDKIFRQITECRKMSIPVLPPDVNQSGESFTLTDEGIRFGLGDLKNVGKAAHGIVGRTTDLATIEDVLEILGTNRNKRVFDGLVQSGALDKLIPNRRSAFLMGEKILTQYRKNKTIPEIPEVDEWSPTEKLHNERKVMGFYISGHPADQVSISGRSSIGTIEASEEEVMIVGAIHNLELKNSKKGDQFAAFTIEDQDGVIKAFCWPKVYKTYGSSLDGMTARIFRGFVQEDERGKIFIVNSIEEPYVAAGKPKHITIALTKRNFKPEKMKKIYEFITNNPGESLVDLRLTTENGSAIFRLPEGISGFDDVILKLEKVSGKNTVTIDS